MTFPLQILSLELDSSDNILGIQDTLTLSIDEANLPDDIIFIFMIALRILNMILINYKEYQ